eukprot:TRINITY_DN16122_c0_g1_i1.p1 TRINITY_DN16122_c0_g1~~TRINITY_DN16122_c0_g1_i1.p1  ORF type:complete len:672 (-),score=105.01 TRINITY_DN16122_c0_g1_i1:24-1784(-)
MMQEELSLTMGTFTENLACTVGDKVRSVVLKEMDSLRTGMTTVQALSPPGGDATTLGDNALSAGRKPVRSNINAKRSKQKHAFLKRTNVDSTAGNDLGRGVTEPLLSDLPHENTEEDNNADIKAEESTVRKQATLKWYQDQLEVVLSSDHFETFIGLIITISSVMVGLRAENISRTLDESAAPSILQFVDMVTLLIFTSEIVARIAVEPGTFLTTSENVGWNIFDSIVVVSQIFETTLSYLVEAKGTGIFGTLRIIRVVRIMRLLRIFRLIRLTRIFIELRTIASTLVHTMRSLFGAIGAFGLVIYLAGVFVTEQVAFARVEMLETGQNANIEPAVVDHFGSLFRSMLTLFLTSTNGMLWGEPLEDLSSGISFIMSPLFCLYSAFVNFAMLNIITGIFVKQSMDAASEAVDESIIMQINALFNRQSGAPGQLTHAEYVSVAQSPQMNALFAAINLDSSETELLFALLDHNGDGIIAYDEFINGALRLRGPARSVELSMFSKDMLSHHRQMVLKMKSIDEKLLELSCGLEANGRAVRDLHQVLYARPLFVESVTSLDRESTFLEVHEEQNGDKDFDVLAAGIEIREP